MVSVDREESFRILTQFTFIGNEHATAAAYGVTSDRSWRRILLETCAETFRTKGLFRVNVNEPTRVQFFLTGSEERARITVNLRIRLLGRVGHRVIVWPVGGLLAQLLEDSEPPLTAPPSKRTSKRTTPGGVRAPVT